jgi:hypothetical protein
MASASVSDGSPTETTIPANVLPDFLAVVERAGTSFAFPTRTVHLVSEQT